MVSYNIFPCVLFVVRSCPIMEHCAARGTVIFNHKSEPNIANIAVTFETMATVNLSFK